MTWKSLWKLPQIETDDDRHRAVEVLFALGSTRDLEDSMVASVQLFGG